MVARPSLLLFVSAAVTLFASACGGEGSDAAGTTDTGSPKDSSTGETVVDSSSDGDPPKDASSGDIASLFEVESDDAKSDVSDACVSASCDVASGPGTYCTYSVAIKPYVSRLGGGFQSVSGTGAQTTIVVRFSKPVESVTVTAVDPDAAGNRMDALNSAGKIIATVPFDVDGKPGVVSMSTKTVSAKGIMTVHLVPGALDFVWYQKLSFTYCP